MVTFMRFVIKTVSFAIVVLLSQSASALELKSYKNKLFSYPAVLEKGHGGDYLKLDYRSSRDMDERDKVRGARVKSYYVSKRGRRGQKKLTFIAGGRQVEYGRTGKPKGAQWIMVFLHGRNGDRSLGLNDYNFGGNFNRLKNLAVRNKGLYLTPTITNFETAGAQDVAALVDRYAKQSPGAQIMLACGSMGSFICWQYLTGVVPIKPLGGIFMMGAIAENRFLGTAYAKGKAEPVPIVFAHGTDDTVFNWKQTQNLFESLKVARPNYPARLLLFETGSHGTPIRMIDWRREINWVLSHK